MMHLIQKTANAIRRNEAGSAIVEYALVLPIFLMMMIGGFEMGRVYMVNASLEGAVTESARTAMTGALPIAYATRSDYIQALILSSLKTAGVTSGITISTQVYNSFKNVGKPEPFVDLNGNLTYDSGECFTDVNNNATWDTDMGSTGLGGEENIMIMKVDVTLPYMTGFMKAILKGVGAINLSATTAIRNEPFGGVSWEPSNNVICS